MNVSRDEVNAYLADLSPETLHTLCLRFRHTLNRPRRLFSLWLRDWAVDVLLRQSPEMGK